MSVFMTPAGQQAAEYQIEMRTEYSSHFSSVASGLCAPSYFECLLLWFSATLLNFERL